MPKQPVNEKIELIEVPYSLLKLLVAEKEDMKDPTKYEELQKVSKAMGKLLLKLAEE